MTISAGGANAIPKLERRITDTTNIIVFIGIAPFWNPSKFKAV
jgi:hypothetical protein